MSFKPNSLKLLSIILPLTLIWGCKESTHPDLYWSMGDFSIPSYQLKHQCEEPRVGTDPFNGKFYPDRYGSTFSEKMYLRAFNHETYLWYDEVIDTDPLTYDTVAHYFASLITSDKTPQGRFKDRFHYIASYDDYMKAQKKGLKAGFGFHFKTLHNQPPRDIRIAYTDDHSPASLQGVVRGDQLLEINGIDVVNTVVEEELSLINQVLSDPDLNQVVTFMFQSTETHPKVVTLTATEVITTPVHNVKVIPLQDKYIGYMQFNSFVSHAQMPLIEAFTFFKDQDIDELIIDLRYNGGGLIGQSAQVAYMISGKSEASLFAELIYNDKMAHITQQGHNQYQFIDRQIDWENNQPTHSFLPSLNSQRLFVLTSAQTASASELLINGLRGVDIDVIQIGLPTLGKPYGFVPEQNCGNMYFTVQFQSINAKGFYKFDDGFIPTDKDQVSVNTGLDNLVEGCLVSDDLTQLLGDPKEGLLSAALEYITSQRCPDVEPTVNASYNAGYIQHSPSLFLKKMPWHNESIHLPLDNIYPHNP
ncbi:S41 family peptidase [Vibrio sagamiensis]|nr:S41 family peptidase [Vibrio sagamiensis]